MEIYFRNRTEEGLVQHLTVTVDSQKYISRMKHVVKA